MFVSTFLLLYGPRFPLFILICRFFCLRKTRGNFDEKTIPAFSTGCWRIRKARDINFYRQTMAQFQRKDSHFVVYFPTDKTVHVLSKAKIIFQSESFEDENVKVMWKTSNIKEDGTVVVEDMAYDGVIVFSGSK